jgi:hypothetical protein
MREIRHFRAKLHQLSYINTPPQPQTQNTVSNARRAYANTGKLSNANSPNMQRANVLKSQLKDKVREFINQIRLFIRARSYIKEAVAPVRVLPLSEAVSPAKKQGAIKQVLNSSQTLKGKLAIKPMNPETELVKGKDIEESKDLKDFQALTKAILDESKTSVRKSRSPRQSSAAGSSAYGLLQ